MKLFIISAILLAILATWFIIDYARVTRFRKNIKEGDLCNWLIHDGKHHRCRVVLVDKNNSKCYLLVLNTGMRAWVKTNTIYP